MGTLYIDTGGSTTNSGSRDTNTALYTGSAATVSGSVVTLDGSPDLSVLSTSGDSQDTIHINDATNSNMRIFWITAVDNTAKTVTVHAAPTGVVSSAWSIGGRHVLTNASIEGALRAGDTAIFNNSPASGTGARWTFRNAGTPAAGFAKIRGATGVRPVLTTTNTAVCVDGAGLNMCWIENLELVQQGASGAAVGSPNIGSVFLNVRVSDAGGDGIVIAANARIINCEVSGVGGVGINLSGNGPGVIVGCYVHDCGGNGITIGAAAPVSVVINTIIDTCSGRGIQISGAATTQGHCVTLFGNTIYGCLDSGIETTDSDIVSAIIGNILKDNGNTSTEYNIEWTPATTTGFHLLGFSANNIFNISGGAGGGNVLNYSLTATDLTGDPLFANASGGDFSLDYSSPARAAGFPASFLSGSTTAFVDIGAVQRKERSSGFRQSPCMTGGMQG